MCADKLGLLLLGVGGPTADYEHHDFTQTLGLVAETIEEEAEMAKRATAIHDHYRVAGQSAYIPQSQHLRDELAQKLLEHGIQTPVACGFRHWEPNYQDSLRSLVEQGCNTVLPVILGSYESRRSWDIHYLELAAQLGSLSSGPAMRCLEPPDPITGSTAFIQCAATHLQQTTQSWSPERRAAAELIMVTQALPRLAERKSPEYRKNFTADAAAIAEAAGWAHHQAAFIGAPEDEADRWSQPRLKDVLDVLQATDSTDVVCFASGFPLDGVEVEFDLDVTTAEACAKNALTFTRVPALAPTTGYASLLAAAVQKQLQRLELDLGLDPGLAERPNE
jgi:protoheme ferro-lyase